MNRVLKLLMISSLMLLLSCKPTLNTAIGIPKIQAGTAKLTGKIIIPNTVQEKAGQMEIFVPHPISGEILNYKTEIDKSGRFSIDINVETDISLIGLFTSFKPYNSLLIKVKSGTVTTIDITYNSSLEIEDVIISPEMDKYAAMKSLPIMNQMLGVYNDVPEPQIPLYDKNPAAHLNYIKTTVSEKLKTLEKDSLLSPELKGILAKDFWIGNYRMRAFDYEKSMKFNFRNFVKDSTATPKIQKVNRSYFGFLKDLDLNNPQYLICSNFIDFQNEMLKNKTLGLPEIGEHDIASWLASAKDILSDALGFRDGQYYDILAANAFGRQLNEEVRPLTENQKKNIATYWKDGEIAKILLRKNQQLVEKKEIK